MTIARSNPASPDRAASTARRLVMPLSVLLVALAALQLTIAGGAVFGAASWAMHVGVGMLVVVVALILAVVAIPARPGRAVVGLAAGALVLAIAQPMTTVLAERVNPSFGLAHGLGAAALVVLASLLLVVRPGAPARD
jgi:hypothetical protein